MLHEVQDPAQVVQFLHGPKKKGKRKRTNLNSLLHAKTKVNKLHTLICRNMRTITNVQNLHTYIYYKTHL